MIDIGVNLTDSRFASDLDNVLNRAQHVGIKRLLVTSTNLTVSQQAIALCQKYPQLLTCTVGIHPHDADNINDNFIEKLAQLAQHDCVKSIGECGLDFNRNFADHQNQIKVFKQQIILAEQLNMPLFLHQRDAFKPWFTLLSPYFNRISAMVAHCFTGNKEQLQQCLDAGMYIGITGWICDERRGKELQSLVQYIPLKNILLETDAPYLLPRTIKAQPTKNRNEPSFLPYIVEAIAKYSAYTTSEIIEQSHLNAQRVFNLSGGSYA